MILVMTVLVYLLSKLDQIFRISAAIARAEGYFAQGSLPQRLNNPGAIKDPATGQLARFQTPADGWHALRRQISLMLTGKSRFYRPDMTIVEIARIYTGNDNPEAWAKIVAGQLGVTPTTPIRDA